MASEDFNKLSVLIEANTKSYENAMKKLEAKTNKALAGVSRSTKRSASDFKRLENSMRGSTALVARLGIAIAGAFSVREIQRFMDANTRIENSLKVAGLAGDDLKKVYDALYSSAQRNAAPFETLANLYGKVALAQSELGATSDELFAFTDKVAVALRVSGKSAEESRGALIQLSQAMGGGIVRAEEFNAILEGALPIAQAVAAGLTEAGGSVAKLRTLIIDGKVSSEAFFRAFEAGSYTLDDKVASSVFTVSQKLETLFNTLIVTAGKFDDATGASEAFKDILDDVVGFLSSADLSNFVDEIGTVISAVGSAIQSFETWRDSIRETLGLTHLDKFLEGTSLIRGEIGMAKEEAAQLAKEMTDAEFIAAGGDPKFINNDGTYKKPTPVSIKDFKTVSTKKDKSGEKRANEIKREQESIRELIATLQEEITLVGASDLAKEKANATRKLGASLTTDQKAKIEELTETLYREQQAWEAAQEAKDFFAETAFDGLMGIVDGSKSANDAINDLVKSLARAAMEAMLLGKGPLAGIFQTQNTGGILGAAFGSFLGGSSVAGARGAAGGGTVAGGIPRMVGERGPELFIPNTSGKIVANQNTPMGGTAPVINIFNSSGEPVSQKSRKSGGVDIVDVMIGKVGKAIGSGQMDDSMNRYGVRPQARRVG